MSISFDHYPVKVLHLEPTDVCNAACPLCPRELNASFDKATHNHLTVNQIKNLFSEEFIIGLDKMFMCGNYGDPAAGLHTLEIYQYFREINPGIVLGMNTNGSLRTPQWWSELAKIMNNPRDYVVWSLDGLHDTNHIYRVNTKWARIMNNVQEFIRSGGNAHWDMLVYEYNKHQVTEAEALARSMGFSWFRAKVSRRANNIAELQTPAGWRAPLLPSEGAIKCYAEQEKSLYVSAQGVVYPCCWMGSSKLVTSDDFGALVSSWDTPKCHFVCKKTCTIQDNETTFTDQWRRNINLKYEN
jgi:hypothetical protein